MRKIQLSIPAVPVHKNELLHTSKGKNTRLYEILFPHRQGLEAHIRRRLRIGVVRKFDLFCE
ncbi:hypothetical protein [Thermicanus aegyptius]|uniref:hypothetical protein n=1 Tax=Thermicanus aegyptius TaxID=94009 RepID=UPI0004292978|nr:hypothetical protein [Thermicanus aegyptius]